MATPTIDGLGASRSGATLAARVAEPAAVLGPMPLGMTNPLLWGFLVALALMAYWYRRVL